MTTPTTFVPPDSYEEYCKLFSANMVIDGTGFQTVTHAPCPFCAYPHFMALGILTAGTDMQKEAKCVACGRSAKMIVQKDAPTNVGLEVVQTGGPDAPPWLPPIRRIS